MEAIDEFFSCSCTASHMLCISLLAYSWLRLKRWVSYKVYVCILKGDSTIRRLNLSGNNVGDKGATLLAEMLKVGSFLLLSKMFHCILPMFCTLPSCKS